MKKHSSEIACTMTQAHILLWTEERLHQIDSMISAKLSNLAVEQEFMILQTHMIYRPCGALYVQSPCFKDGQCTKCIQNLLSKDNHN